MPTIAEAITANQQRIAKQGTVTVPPNSVPISSATPPSTDGPVDRPLRGSFPRSMVAADTFEKVTGQFYGRMRARALTNPAGSDLPANAAAIGTSKTTVVTQVPTPDLDPFLHFRGKWASSTTYFTNDVVIDNLSAYVAIAGSTGIEPDQNNPANWTLLSENLVFNPTLSRTVGFALESIEQEVITTGTSGTLAGGPIAPAVSNDLALWFGCYSNGGHPPSANAITNITPAGWTSLSPLAAIYQLLSNTSSISPTAAIGSTEPWCSIITTWSFGGGLTATITQVQIDLSNVCTITCANTFSAGEVVSLSGLTTATFLNGQTVTLTSATSTQIVFSFTHATYGPTADTGTVSLVFALQNASGGGAFNPATATLPSNVTAGNTILVTLITGNGVVINSITDTQGNTYQLFTSTNSMGLSVAFAQNVKSGSTSITANLSGLATGATVAVSEIQGRLSFTNYLPYDVVEFRGSIFVCLQATNNDAFTQPAAWGLIGPGTGFTQVKIANYTAVQADEGNLLSFNSSSNLTLTLPNPLPLVNGKIDSGFWVAVQNIGTGTLTISPNGRTLDGTSSLVLLQNQGCLIFTDGINFYTVRSAASGSGFVGGVNSQTVSYTAVFGDGGKLISMNGSNLTLTLPATPPNSIWMIFVENLNNTNLTISPNGLTIDGSGSNLTLGQNQGIIIFTDGTNYFTCHGVNHVTVPSWLVATGPDGSGSVVITSATEPANQVLASPNGSSGPISPRALVPADLPPLAVASAVGIDVTSSQNGTLEINGAVVPAGTYRVCAYFVLTKNPSAGTLDVNIGWNDGTAARTATNGTNGMPADISTAATNFAQGETIVEADGVHDITWAMTLT